MRRHRFVTLCAATALAAASCRDAGPVRFGIIMSSPGVAGAQLAVSEINESGGIGGRPLELRVMSEGSATGARLALIAADSLASDPTIIAAIAHGNSSASLAGSQVYNANRLVQLAATSTSPMLSRAGPYSFRMVPSDIHQGRFLADEIAAGGGTGGKPRTAVFFVSDDYGRALHQELRARLAELGVPVVLDAAFAENVPLPDVEATARGVAAARAEVLVWLGRSQLRELLPAVRRLMPQIRVLAGDGVDNETTQRNADGILTGVRYVCFVDIKGTSPGLVKMRDRFERTTRTMATVESALAYDAVMLLAAAAREAGTTREAVHEYMQAVGSARPAFSGVTGTIAFDANGDPAPSYCLAEVTSQGSRVVRTTGRR